MTSYLLDRKWALILWACLAVCGGCSKKHPAQPNTSQSAQGLASEQNIGSSDIHDASAASPATGPTPETVADETLCAAHWLRDQGEFEREIGLLSKSDQITINGQPMDMVKAFPKTPASSNFDFPKCGQYGYVRPTTLREYSVNRWTATITACKLLDPNYLAKVRVIYPQASLEGTEDLECSTFRTKFGDASALESHLRDTSHPIN